MQADHDALQLRAALQVPVHLGQQNAGAAGDGKAEDARGDRGNRDRALAVAVGQGERRAHGGGELAVFVALAHPRADRVDHLLGLQRAGARHHRGADRRTADAVALVLDGRAALLAYGAGDAAAELQFFVRRIDDRVDCQLRDVALDQLEQRVVHPDGHYLFSNCRRL